MRKGRHNCMAGECELIAMKLREEEKADPDRRRVLQRIVVLPDVHVQEHHWGRVYPRPGGARRGTCLGKGRFRVRTEGWADDVVVPAEGWSLTDGDDCWGNIVIGVWTPERTHDDTGWGPLPEKSGHENTYWIAYAGPMTRGRIRRAGPFGCTGDPVDHAMEDGGFSEPGVDGGYVIYDAAGNVVKDGT